MNPPTIKIVLKIISLSPNFILLRNSKKRGHCYGPGFYLMGEGKWRSGKAINNSAPDEINPVHDTVLP